MSWLFEITLICDTLCLSVFVPSWHFFSLWFSKGIKLEASLAFPVYQDFGGSDAVFGYGCIKIFQHGVMFEYLFQFYL